MSLEDRILEAESKFKQLDEQRQTYIKGAEDCLTEMTKLQGEWRVLQELLDGKKPNKQADTIEVIPEEVE